MLHMVRIMVLTALLVMLPQVGQPGSGNPPNLHPQRPGRRPGQRAGPIQRSSSSSNATPAADRSWWDILGDLNGFTVELLISGLLWLIGQFASLMVFWAYVIQKFILFTGYALSPLLIGLMAIPPLRSIGSRYLMHLVGVLLWPLGWAVAALITQGILDFMTDPSFKFFDPTASFYSLQATLGRRGAGVLDCLQHGCRAAGHPEGLRRRRTGGRPTHRRRVQQFLQTAATTAGAAAVAVHHRHSPGHRRCRGHGRRSEHDFHRRRTWQRRSHHHRRERVCRRAAPAAGRVTTSPATAPCANSSPRSKSHYY